MKENTRDLFDFSGQGAEEGWRSIDDVVMGGVSGSEFHVVSHGIAVFTGAVSLQHGGGFASVRSRPARMDLSEYAGLEIRVRGDGKRYRLRLRTDPNLYGVAYQVSFEPRATVWQSIRLPFRSFRPIFRGRTVLDVPPLDTSSVVSFGWMIADKQAGPFRLEIDWLRAYADEGF